MQYKVVFPTLNHHVHSLDNFEVVIDDGGQAQYLHQVQSHALHFRIGDWLNTGNFALVLGSHCGGGISVSVDSVM